MKLDRRSFEIRDFNEPNLGHLLNIYLDKIREAIESKIDSQQSFVVKSPPVAGNEFRVFHDLGYIPNNFLIVSRSGAGEIYPSGTAWTQTLAFFKCTTVKLALKVAIW